MMIFFSFETYSLDAGFLIKNLLKNFKSVLTKKHRLEGRGESSLNRLLANFGKRNENFSFKYSCTCFWFFRWKRSCLQLRRNLGLKVDMKKIQNHSLKLGTVWVAMWTRKELQSNPILRMSTHHAKA